MTRKRPATASRLNNVPPLRGGLSHLGNRGFRLLRSRHPRLLLFGCYAAKVTSPSFSPWLCRSSRRVGRGSLVARPSSACDPSYLLHGLMSCPYCENNGNCGCGYTQGTAGKSGTRYYLCQYHNKYRTPCPVGRLNADVMEYSVLTAIHRASQHKTVMHKMIADSNTWAKAPDSLHDEITAIQKRLKEVNASIDNIVKFIETGGFSETLASRLNTLEATKASYTQKASEVRLAIANASKKRPTADMVQACWGRATEAWPRLNDKQRSTVLSAVVKHVSVTSKSSVVATLATSPHFTDRMLAPNSIMGAGEGLEPPTFGL